MKLSEFKKQLTSLKEVNFILEDGSPVPAHFHVTEMGQVTKHFIDCGGTVRVDKTVNFQLWQANDTEHRLVPEKLVKIISLSEKVLNVEDSEIEVEYQAGTIGKYGLEYDNGSFVLTTKQTACLAIDSCGTPESKKKLALQDIQGTKSSCCAPGSGCC